MSSDANTRSRLLRAASDLFRQQGYHATGLNQVLTASHAPKGSLYFHFPGGKEQLGAEAVTEGAQETGAQLSHLIGNAASLNAALTGVAELLARELAGSEFRVGCPVATVALDAACDSEPIRTACLTAYQDWSQTIATNLVRWGVPESRTEQLATVILAAFEGALLLAKVGRDPAPLHAVAEQIGALLPEGR